MNSTKIGFPIIFMTHSDFYIFISICPQEGAVKYLTSGNQCVGVVTTLHNPREVDKLKKTETQDEDTLMVLETLGNRFFRANSKQELNIPYSMRQPFFDALEKNDLTEAMKSLECCLVECTHQMIEKLPNYFSSRQFACFIKEKRKELGEELDEDGPLPTEEEIEAQEKERKEVYDAARKRASEEAAKKQEELGSLSYSEEEDSSDSDNDDDDDDDESEEVSENDDDDELEKVHDSTLVSFGVIEMKGTDVTVHVPPCELTKRYKTFYYQVCPIGGYAPLYILTEMKKNKFKIGSTEKVHLRISWEIRGDALK
eukprot:TRINITY_DN11864_c0_g1_i7.p1 TRINITY_DN11864_c0_g1~~TRINITY_DN11864_c0_g1_i7.p1  ORF type:complete len:313 (+),score=81.86 TRINITY_DN11864_c0_g1_i7:431-1369(+)